MESQRSPEAPTAAGVTRELGTHSGDLAAACRDMGHGCQEYADQVDDSHREIVSTCQELLAWTAVDQVSGAVLSFVTAGGAEVAAQLVETGVMARYAARVVAVLRRLAELARAAAALMSRGIGRIAEILARLKTLPVAEGRASAGEGRLQCRRTTGAGEADAGHARCKWTTRSRGPLNGKQRFPLHDGKDFRNDNPRYRLPPGSYQEWTVATSGAQRGVLPGPDRG